MIPTTWSKLSVTCLLGGNIRGFLKSLKARPTYLGNYSIKTPISSFDFDGLHNKKVTRFISWFTNVSNGSNPSLYLPRKNHRFFLAFMTTWAQLLPTGLFDICCNILASQIFCVFLQQDVMYPINSIFLDPTSLRMLAASQAPYLAC